MNSRVFFENVEREFAFLTEEYGFSLNRRQEVSDNLCAEYRSSVVFVRILKTFPDFEPRFVFGRIGIDGTPDVDCFDWIDVAELECCRDWKWQHSERETLAGRLKQLARLLRDCGDEALRGEGDVYVKMLNRRHQLTMKHLNEEKSRLIRSRANAAWNERDYKKVLELYSELEEQLSTTERNRMSFAEKQCSDQFEHGLQQNDQRQV